MAHPAFDGHAVARSMLRLEGDRTKRRLLEECRSRRRTGNTFASLEISGLLGRGGGRHRERKANAVMPQGFVADDALLLPELVGCVAARADLDRGRCYKASLKVARRVCIEQLDRLGHDLRRQATAPLGELWRTGVES
jgi:hypothetical protein